MHGAKGLCPHVFDKLRLISFLTHNDVLLSTMKKLLFLLLAALLLSSAKQKPIVWVAIGDSITYLNDHLDETGNRVTKGYLTRVAGALPNLHYVNQGHNGWKASDIAGQIESLGLIKADVYTVF